MARAQRGTESQATGRSKGGMTTKILAFAGALGNLARCPATDRPPERTGQGIVRQRQLADLRVQDRYIDRRRGRDGFRTEHIAAPSGSRPVTG